MKPGIETWMTDITISLQYDPADLNWSKRKNKVKCRRLGKKEKTESILTDDII